MTNPIIPTKVSINNLFAKENLIVPAEPQVAQRGAYQSERSGSEPSHTNKSSPVIPLAACGRPDDEQISHQPITELNVFPSQDIDQWLESEEEWPGPVVAFMRHQTQRVQACGLGSENDQLLKICAGVAVLNKA